MPHLVRWAADHSEQGLLVAAVFRDAEPKAGAPDELAAYLRDNRVQQPVWRETTREWTDRLGIKGYPLVLVLDARGVVVWEGPLSQNQLEAIDAAVRKELAGRREPTPDWDRVAAGLGRQGRVERRGVYVVPIQDREHQGAISWSGDLQAARADLELSGEPAHLARWAAALRRDGFDVDLPARRQAGEPASEEPRSGQLVARRLGEAHALAEALRRVLGSSGSSR